MDEIKKNNLKGIFWMIGTIICFCLMGVTIKELSFKYNSFEIQNFRNILCILIILLFYIFNNNIKISTKQFKNNLIRNFFHFIGQSGWTYGLTVLPLATVFSIEFTMPIWATIIAIVIFKDKLTVFKFIFLTLGMIGTWVIVVPDTNTINANCIIVLISAIFYAFAHNYTKILTKTDNTISVIFWMSLIQLPFTIIGSLLLGKIQFNIFNELPLIILLALSALGAHFCLTSALRAGEPSLVLPIDYLRLPLIYLVGWYLYNESLSTNIIVGSIMIMTGAFILIKKNVN